MKTWAFASAKSSPGVTTTVMAAASVWPTPVMVAELGADGGVLAGRLSGLTVDTGLLSLSVALRSGPANAAAHSQEVAGTDDHIRVLVSPPTAESAVAVARSIGGRLDDCLGGTGRDVLIDAGRVGVEGLAGPIAQACDGLIVVARSNVEDLWALRARWDTITKWHGDVAVLLVGTDPYGPADVADVIGCRVLGAVAHDPSAAAALAGQAATRRLRRSKLLRTAAGVVDDHLTEAPTAGEVSSKLPAQPTDVRSPVDDGAPDDEEASTHV